MAFVCDIPARPTVQRDDEGLRITRWDFPPGAVTGWHEHGWPYLVVMLDAGILRVHDGARTSDTSLARGQSYTRPAGVRHDVMNASPHPLSFVEVEFKRAGGADALALNP